MAVTLQDIPQQERWNKIREILQENFNLLNLAIGTGGGGDIDLTGIATEQYVDEKDSKLRTDLAYAVLKPAAALMANKDGKGRVIDETYLLKEELKTLLSGKINLSSKSEVTKAQNLLTQTNEVAFYLVTDSSGKIPSSQSCYNIPSDIVKQLSLTSPNSVTNAALALATSSTTLGAVGVNVGDLVALTRVKVKVSDLTAALGINLSLSGEIEMYQYKILSMNDAKATGHSEASAGVMGLMSPWDKGQVNKISALETASSELNRGNKKTMFTSGNYNIDQCLDGGIYLYGRTGRSMAGNHSDEYYIVSVDTRYNRSDSKYYVTQRVYSVNYKNRAFERLIVTSATNNYNGTYNDWIQLTEEQYFSESDKSDFDTIRTWYNNVVGNIPEGDTLDGIITALDTGLANLEEKHAKEFKAVNEEISKVKNGTTTVGKADHANSADNVGDLSAGDIQSFIDDATGLFEELPNTYAQKSEALKSANIAVSQGTDKATLILEGQYADGTVLNPSASGVDIPAATTSKAGLMSSDMLKKIDNIQSGVDNIPIMQLLQEDKDNQILIPYMQNDIAYPIARGGYIKMWKDGVESALTDTICNGLPDYVDVRGNTTTVSEVVIEIDTNQTLQYSQRVYIAFSSLTWCAKSIKLETKVAVDDEWVVVEEVTDFSGSVFSSKLPTTGATSYRYLRFTLSNFKSYSCRIADIGVASFNGKGLKNIVLPLGGGSMYGHIYPYKDVAYDLGSGSKRWKTIYADTFQGKATDNTPVSVKVNEIATKTEMNSYLPETLKAGGHLNLIVEDSYGMQFIPFLQNDIAYFIEQGGDVTCTIDGQPFELSETKKKALADGKGDTLLFSPTEIPSANSVVVLELSLNKNFRYVNIIYIAAMSANRAKDTKVEVYAPSIDEWAVVWDRQNQKSGLQYLCWINTFEGGSNATPWNKIRLTMTNFTGSTHRLRINQIGVITYDSLNATAICLPRNGGDIYGGITPLNSSSYDLGSSSNKWKTIYADTFQGKATLAADVDVTNNVATNGDRPLIWAGGNVGNSSSNGATDLYKSYGDLSYNPSKKRLTTGLLKGALESVATPNSGTYLLQYYAGQPALGDEAGNAKEGSNADPNLWSYPEGGTFSGGTKANIQTLRLKWSNDYFHDFFVSPNQSTLWHRTVSGKAAYPWKKIVESDADGNVVLDGGLAVNGNYNVKTEIENAKTEIDKKSTAIDVTALFTVDRTIAGLTHDMLCKATLYVQGTGGDAGAPVRFYPSGSLRDGIGTNPTAGYLVAEAINYVGSSIGVDKRIATITIDSTGATCISVETRYGEL